MDELAICTQVTAILSNITGIKKAFDYDETPPKLNPEDLPAAVPLIGPMPYRDVTIPGGRASSGVDELQEFSIRIYVSPTTQGMSIGEVVSTTAAFLGLVLNAFDGRPKLINADGSSPSDFDYEAAGLMRAFLTGHSGIVIRPYGARMYFAIEFALRVDGKRVTSKIEGN